MRWCCATKLRSGRSSDFLVVGKLSASTQMPTGSWTLSEYDRRCTSEKIGSEGKRKEAIAEGGRRGRVEVEVEDAVGDAEIKLVEEEWR